MFSIRGVKEGCGLYGIEHLVLFILTITIIFIVLHFTKRFNHNQVQKVLKITCILFSLTINIKSLKLYLFCCNVAIRVVACFSSKIYSG